MLSLVIGFWGLNLLFSDSPPGQPEWVRLVYIVAWHFLPSIIVGLLLPRRWFFGLLGGWGAALLGAFELLGVVRGWTPSTYLPRILFDFLGLPAIVLVGSYVGASLRSSHGNTGEMK